MNYRYCPVCGQALTEAEHGGKLRLACPKDDWVHWDNPIPVVAAVVERNGHVVLVQSHGWPAQWFGLVTGFLERDEAPEDAVLREVKEELGLEGHLGEFIGLYPFFRRNQLIMAYHVEAHAGEIELEAAELNDHREIPLARLRPWRAGTGYALADWLRRRGYEPKFVDLPRR